VDNDQNKDGVGRIGFDAGFIAGGISGWYGETFRPSDGTTPGKTYPRTRMGADLQLYLDLLGIGGTALKWEWIAGRTYMRGGVEQFGVAANGYYATLTQNLGLKHAFSFRYDTFDPDAGRPNDADSANPAIPASTNIVHTLGIAYIHHWDEALKVTLAYEVPLTQSVPGASDPQDNLFTLQLQARF
jgi:hypothetical protein